MTTLTRYTLLQVPGWLFAALLLIGIRHWFGLPLWAAAGLWLAWVGKDFVLYPFLRHAYETETKTGAERLVGLHGKVQRSLDPHGYVRINGELWRAETEFETTAIPPGSCVKVQATRGLTLIVEPEGKRG